MYRYRPTRTTVSNLTEGDCWVLAGILHDLTGWPIVAMVDGPTPPGQRNADWYHMAVQTPDSRVLDIHGPQTRDEFLTRWSRGPWSNGTGRLVTISRADWEFEAAGWNNTPVIYRSPAPVERVAKRLLRAHYPSVAVDTRTRILVGSLT